MDSFDILDYLRPLLRWWWLLVASTVIAASFSAYTVLNQPPVYRAYTTLMVGTALADPNPSSSEFGLANQLASAYADMARRAPIANATKEALGLSRLPSYTVWHVPQTQIIEITVTDVDPQRAQAVAAELVNQLVLQTPGSAGQSERQSFVDQQLDEMEQSILATQEEIKRLNRELEGLFSARQIADTNNQIAALQTKLSALQANYAALLQNSRRGASNTLNVLEPANLPTAPVGDQAMMMVLAAGMLGFALAAAGAYLLEYLDDTFRFEDTVQRRLDLPVLAMIPSLGRQALQDGGLNVEAVTYSPAGHAFGGLRIALDAAMTGRPSKTLLVSSPGISEGKSFVAANLCVEMARAGERVILVDADLRRPSQQRLFRLPNLAGLTTAFQHERLVIHDLLQPTSIPGLSVLTSGPLPSNVVQILSSVRMQTLLKLLESEADKVVIDAPPVAAAVDASILATHVDGVLLVVGMGKTRGRLAARAVKLLRQLHANLVGVVIDNASLKASHYSHTYEYGLKARKGGPNWRAKKRAVLYLNGANAAESAHPTASTSPRDKGEAG